MIDIWAFFLFKNKWEIVASVEESTLNNYLSEKYRIRKFKEKTLLLSKSGEWLEENLPQELINYSLREELER